MLLLYVTILFAVFIEPGCVQIIKIINFICQKAWQEYIENELICYTVDVFIKCCFHESWSSPFSHHNHRLKPHCAGSCVTCHPIRKNTRSSPCHELELVSLPFVEDAFSGTIESKNSHRRLFRSLILPDEKKCQGAYHNRETKWKLIRLFLIVYGLFIMLVLSQKAPTYPYLTIYWSSILRITYAHTWWAIFMQNCTG